MQYLTQDVLPKTCLDKGVLKQATRQSQNLSKIAKNRVSKFCVIGTMTFSIMTFDIITLSIKGLFAT
jgi:hypothetical protein